MPPKGSKVRGGPAHLGHGVVHVVGEHLHDAGPPARRGRAEVGQPAVVRLHPGPTPLVVLGVGGSATRLPSAKKGGTVLGKSTSAAMPSDSVSASRRSLSQLR